MSWSRSSFIPKGHGQTMVSPSMQRCVPFGMGIAPKPAVFSQSLKADGKGSSSHLGSQPRVTWGPTVGADASLSSRWRGDYGGKKQLWFPSNYVEEISSPSSLEPEREVSWGGQWGGARVRGAWRDRACASLPAAAGREQPPGGPARRRAGRALLPDR